ncbi:MAG TPA: DUF6458 family protein [Actinomycetota bacterium]|nr:DUF6458 family protein [Actinomycetota bacterium]
MAIGTSLFLLAVGAILTFAVEAEFAGIDIEVVGIILMVIGGLGILLSLFMLNRSRTTRVERRYYDDGSPR